MSSDRLLLIKAWSYILWADVNHVLGQLLIAELTNRIPVVYWSTYCLHNGFVQTNGFELYFEPVSNYTIFNIAKPDYTFYPPIWDCDNLLIEDKNKETWAYRSIGDFMCSNANVVVCDVHFDVYEIIPFIKKTHPAYGMTVNQIYRYLFNKYIKIKPDIEMEIQGFYNSWLKGSHPVLAVHVRRFDKDWEFDTTNFQTNHKLQILCLNKYKKKTKEKTEKKCKTRRRGKVIEPNKVYHPEIRKCIEKYNIKKIFLLTDCEETVKEYRELYGSKVVLTDCIRIPGDGTVSDLENPMVKRRRGIELIKDAYIASKCDFFIGNDFSSLSRAVTQIKDWPGGSVKLLYWLIKKRKYPVNIEIMQKTEFRFLKNLMERIRKFFDKSEKP